VSSVDSTDEKSFAESTGSRDSDAQPVIPATSEKDLPLHGTWTLWYDNPRLASHGADWKETLRACGTVQHVGTFWGVFNNIKPPSKITCNSNYSVFRAGIEPSWEDPVNVNGGKFVLTIPKKESRAGKCDEYWTLTVLALVGETMDASGSTICGAVVSIRKSQDRIALWLKCHDKATCTQIGARWKKILNLESGNIIRYQTHKAAAESGRSFRNESQFSV